VVPGASEAVVETAVEVADGVEEVEGARTQSRSSRPHLVEVGSADEVDSDDEVGLDVEVGSSGVAAAEDLDEVVGSGLSLDESLDELVAVAEVLAFEVVVGVSEAVTVGIESVSAASEAVAGACVLVVESDGPSVSSRSGGIIVKLALRF
jgi:hypothetical protein